MKWAILIIIAAMAIAALHNTAADGFGDCAFGNYLFGYCDSTPPNVTLISPPNATKWYSSSIITFMFNVTETSSCSIILANHIVYSDNSLNGTAIANVTTHFIGENLEWTANCTDIGNNKANSSFVITLLQPVAGSGSIGGGGGGSPTSSNIFAPQLAEESNTTNTSNISQQHELIKLNSSLRYNFMNLFIPLPNIELQHPLASVTTFKILKYIAEAEYYSKPEATIIIKGIKIFSLLLLILIPAITIITAKIAKNISISLPSLKKYAITLAALGIILAFTLSHTIRTKSISFLKFIVNKTNSSILNFSISYDIPFPQYTTYIIIITLAFLILIIFYYSMKKLNSLISN